LTDISKISLLSGNNQVRAHHCVHGVTIVFAACIIPHLSVSHFTWLFIIQQLNIARMSCNSVLSAFGFIALNQFISSEVSVPHFPRSFMKMLSYDPYDPYNLSSGIDLCGTSLVIVHVQEYCLPIPTSFFFLSFDGDLLM